MKRNTTYLLFLNHLRLCSSNCLPPTLVVELCLWLIYHLFCEIHENVQAASIPGSEVELRKYVLTFLLVMMVFSYLGSQEEDLIMIDASINPRRLSKGNEGSVVLKFIVKKGITINPKPSFTIELSSSEELVFPKNFFTASDLEVEILEDEGKEYLVLTKKIEIPFTVSDEAVRGMHSLEGKVKYFAFSKAENWCLKTTTLFSASFYTR